MRSSLFWIFGVLQSMSLAALIFVLLKVLDDIGGGSSIGPDTRVVLSLAFPLFLILVEFIIFTKK